MATLAWSAVQGTRTPRSSRLVFPAQPSEFERPLTGSGAAASLDDGAPASVIAVIGDVARRASNYQRAEVLRLFA
jgi:hypothetical protein